MIKVDGLIHRFDDKVVLNGIDLSVDKGQLVAIMGSSGGGKTTLLRCIAGLITPTSGKVFVDGEDVAENPEAARRKMGMVFQSAALFDYLNVYDNILFGPRRWFHPSKQEAKAIVEKALATVGLGEIQNLMPSELSGGMRKRVGIARALALRPKVILYDEPTTGLDPVTVYAIDQLMVQLRDDLGVTSLVVSHDVSSVLRVADRVAFLDKGTLAFDGKASDFRNSELESIQEVITRSEAKTLELR